MQLPWQGGLQVRLQELATPTIAQLEGQVYPVSLLLGHGASIGEVKAKVIHSLTTGAADRYCR